MATSQCWPTLEIWLDSKSFHHVWNSLLGWKCFMCGSWLKSVWYNLKGNTTHFTWAWWAFTRCSNSNAKLISKEFCYHLNLVHYFSSFWKHYVFLDTVFVQEKRLFLPILQSFHTNWDLVASSLKLGLSQSRAQCCRLSAERCHILPVHSPVLLFPVWLHTDCAKHLFMWQERERIVFRIVSFGVFYEQF